MREVRVYTPGVFDVLHVGHLSVLEKAKSLGDCLIVGVCSDRLTTLTKSRPVIPEKERKIMIESLKVVDEAIIYDSLDQTPNIIRSYADKFAIGEEFGYLPEHEKALEFCRSSKIPVIRIKRRQGVSSSFIKNLIRSTACEQH